SAPSRFTARVDELADLWHDFGAELRSGVRARRARRDNPGRAERRASRRLLRAGRGPRDHAAPELIAVEVTRGSGSRHTTPTSAQRPPSFVAERSLSCVSGRGLVRGMARPRLVEQTTRLVGFANPDEHFDEVEGRLRVVRKALRTLTQHAFGGVWFAALDEQSRQVVGGAALRSAVVAWTKERQFVSGDGARGITALS